MKVHNVHRIVKYPDRQLYTFNLGEGQLIVNGFVYSRDKGAVMSPTVNRYGKRVRVVRMIGIYVKRLKALLEQTIQEQETASPSPSLQAPEEARADAA